MTHLTDMKQTLIGFGLVLLWFCPLMVEAQLKKLTENDKAQIIEAITKDYDFSDSRTWENEKENAVYLLMENVSSKPISQRKGIKFVIINPKETVEMEKTGIEYYKLEEFKVKKSLVQVFFSRRYIKETNGEIYVRETKYKFQKVSGKWKVKARQDRTFAS